MLILLGDHANTELRLWHWDTIKGTLKHDTVDSAQNASPHCPNEKKYKKKVQSSNGETVKEGVGKPEKKRKMEKKR